jgi:PTH1 family peptidyl-tRNA hydrolase
LKMIVGLGNPGKQYQNNRHNVGFMVVDKFAKYHGIDLNIKKKKAVFGRGKCFGEGAVILKPQTFMNLSGEAVLYLASFLKIKTKDIIVVADDTELPFGMIRIRNGGGSGGHNGIKSLIYSLKSEDFPRVRFGIGKPPTDSTQDLCDYVLENFTSDEKKCIESGLEMVVEALNEMIKGSINEAMNQFNNRLITEVHIERPS